MHRPPSRPGALVALAASIGLVTASVGATAATAEVQSGGWAAAQRDRVPDRTRSIHDLARADALATDAPAPGAAASGVASGAALDGLLSLTLTDAFGAQQVASYDPTDTNRAVSTGVEGDDRRELEWGPAGDRAVHSVIVATDRYDVVTDEDGTKTDTYGGHRSTDSPAAWSPFGDSWVRLTRHDDRTHLAVTSVTRRVSREIPIQEAVAGHATVPQLGRPALSPFGDFAVIRVQGDIKPDLALLDAVRLPLEQRLVDPDFPEVAVPEPLGLGDWAPMGADVGLAAGAGVDDASAPLVLAFTGTDKWTGRPAVLVDHADGRGPRPVAYTEATCPGSRPVLSPSRTQLAYLATTPECTYGSLRVVTADTATGTFDGPAATDRLVASTFTPFMSDVSWKPTGTAPAGVARIGGANRYQVSLNAVGLYPDHEASGLVVAGGTAYADALAGSVLAGQLGGPVVLAPPSQFASATLAELERVLEPGGTVYIVGGQASVSVDVEHQLSLAGFSLTRLSGASRYHVAVNIAKELDRQRGTPPTALFVSAGTAFADALVAAPAAVVHAGSILLVGAGGAMPAVTQSYLSSVYADLDAVYPIGGTGADAVSGLDKAVIEFSGASRYDVARLVADYFFGGESIAALVDGRNWPDAVSGGAFMAHVGQPLLLTGATLPAQSAERLRRSRSSIDLVLTFGGPASVSDQVLEQAAALAGRQTLLWGPDAP